MLYEVITQLAPVQFPGGFDPLGEIDGVGAVGGQRIIAISQHPRLLVLCHTALVSYNFV